VKLLPVSVVRIGRFCATCTEIGGRRGFGQNGHGLFEILLLFLYLFFANPLAFFLEMMYNSVVYYPIHVEDGENRRLTGLPPRAYT
jgi:hypothetical protein